MTDEDLVLTEVDADGVATFTLNRPERRNAWTAPMENRYFDVLAAADTDPAVRVGVLTGAGTSFCPGMDMGRLAEVAGSGEHRRPPAAVRAAAVPQAADRRDQRRVRRDRADPGADVRCAVRRAGGQVLHRFRPPRARRRVRHVLGPPPLRRRGRALDLLLSSRVFEADEARDLGLVNRVVEPGEVAAGRPGVRPGSGAQLFPRRHGRHPSPGARRPRRFVRGGLPPLVRGDGSAEQRGGLPRRRGQLRAEAAPGVPPAARRPGPREDHRCAHPGRPDDRGRTPATLPDQCAPAAVPR